MLGPNAGPPLNPMRSLATASPGRGGVPDTVERCCPARKVSAGRRAWFSGSRTGRSARYAGSARGCVRRAVRGCRCWACRSEPVRVRRLSSAGIRAGVVLWCRAAETVEVTVSSFQRRRREEECGRGQGTEGRSDGVASGGAGQEGQGDLLRPPRRPAADSGRTAAGVAAQGVRQRDRRNPARQARPRRSRQRRRVRRNLGPQPAREPGAVAHGAGRGVAAQGRRRGDRGASGGGSRSGLRGTTGSRTRAEAPRVARERRRADRDPCGCSGSSRERAIRRAWRTR